MMDISFTNQITKVTKKAFSLVELSISLIIISLLVAGVIGGSRIIENSRLHSVISELDEYKSAYLGFKLTYNAIPGDFKDANIFWGNNCDGSGSTNTCSGNGDGDIDRDTEGTRAMYHLLKGDFISDSLTSEVSANFTAGGNIPRSSWQKSGISLWGGGTDSVKASLFLGRAQSSGWNSGEIFSPKQAHFIDKKMDDSLPVAGEVRASIPGENEIGSEGTSNSRDVLAGCADCSQTCTGTSPSISCNNDCNATTKYDLDATTNECIAAFILE